MSAAGGLVPFDWRFAQSQIERERSEQALRLLGSDEDGFGSRQGGVVFGMAGGGGSPTSSGAGGVGPGGSGWTTDTVMAHLLPIIEEGFKRLDDKIDHNDQRYEERWSSGETALATALSMSKELVAQALAAAKEAVGKAETATNTRFKSIDEFRGTLENQQRTLMPRSETEALLKGLTDQMTQQNRALSDQIAAQGKIITTMQSEARGSTEGQHSQWGYIGGAVGIAGGLIAIALELSRIGH